MPILSKDIGSSNMKTTSQPGSSLLYRIVDFTPESGKITSYVPYFEPSWQTGTLGTSRVLAESTIPVALWSVKSGTTKRGDREKALDLHEFYEPRTQQNREILDGLAMQLMPLSTDLVNKPLASDELSLTELGIEDETRYRFEFFETEAQGVSSGENRMFKTIGDYAGVNRNTIGVTFNEKGLQFLWTNSQFEDIARRYNRLIMDQGRWSPSMQGIGLGCVLKKTGNEGVPKRWYAGKSPYLQKKSQTMSGDWHTPFDFIPYGTMRRAAPYHNLWHRAFYNFINRFAEQLDWDLCYAEYMAMSTIILGEYAGFGESVAPSDAPDPTTLADRFLDFVGLPATGSYLDFDPVQYVFSGVTPSSGQLTAKQSDRLRDWLLMSFCLGAVSGVSQAVSGKCHMLFDGGPRPDQVVDRLMMAWRPDVSTGSYNNPLGVTLLTNRIDGTTPPTRFPVLMGTSTSSNSTKNEYMKGQDAISDASCIYTGINEPLTLNGVGTVQYMEGKPQNGMVEEDYYMITPIISRETVTSELYRHRRRFKRVNIPRSAIQGMLPEKRGAVMMFVSDCAGVPSQGFQSTIKPYGARWIGTQDDTSVAGEAIAKNSRKGELYKAKATSKQSVRKLAGNDSIPDAEVTYIETNAPGPIQPAGNTVTTSELNTQKTAGQSTPNRPNVSEKATGIKPEDAIE